jgi:hypothetical protein
MSKENKAIVARWFEGFWGNPWNPKIVDELAAPDMLLQFRCTHHVAVARKSRSS